MAITIEALEAFKAKGIRIDSRIKTKEIALKHATFSGYALLDNFTDQIKDFIERGAIIQNHVKGYLIFSYPANNDEIFADFRHFLYESSNHLRFIGYSDRLIMNIVK